MAVKTYDVRIDATHSQTVYTGVISHEFVGTNADTYHKLSFPLDVTLYVNSFGVKQVLVYPTGTSPNFQ